MYFWLKILHVSAMVLWFAGLFFLPRLFVARHRGERDAAAGYFNATANTLYFRMATPAALVAVATGMALIAFGPRGAWLVMKLVIVAGAVFLHLYMGVALYELGQGRDRHVSSSAAVQAPAQFAHLVTQALEATAVAPPLRHVDLAGEFALPLFLPAPRQPGEALGKPLPFRAKRLF